MLNKLLSPILQKLPENNRAERVWKLAQLDFRKRYYHDNLGIIWSMLRPLFRIGVFYFVFKIVMNYESMPNYGLFIFSGLLFWGIFSEGSNNGKVLLRKKRFLIENIQFNKIDLYLSNSLANFISFFITLFAYSLVAYYVGIRYDSKILYLVILVINLYLITMGTGMILSVMYIFVKDINHLWDIVRLFLFWTSGVFLRGEKFLEFFPPFLYINPLVGIMINVRKVIFYIEPIDMKLLSFCFIYGILLYVLGYAVFTKYSNVALERY